MSNIIEIRNLKKVYMPKNIVAVNDISFSVCQGEFFAFLGENGAGKSTTINILCTLLKHTAGEVFVSGLEVGRDDAQIRRNIGTVFQCGVLDKLLTVRENVAVRATGYGMSKPDIRARMVKLAAELEAEDILDRRYDRLSGGQRRKADLIRALMPSPKLLILDEPTAGLDPASRAGLWRVLNKMRQNKELTIFLTTHYMEETEDADTVAIIHKGKLVCQGSPKELKSKYSHGTLKLEFRPLFFQNEYELKLREAFAGIGYTLAGSTLTAGLKDTGKAIALLKAFENDIAAFEMLSGSMDDVFLNVGHL